MVVIRLARGGRVKQAIYRIVAADKRRSATSKYLAVLGTYNPHTKEIKLNKPEVDKYLANGAQPSDRVLRLLQAEGVKTPDWAKTHDRNKKSKKPAEEVEPNTGAAAETAAEAGDKTEAASQSIDAPETADSEEKVAKDQKEATEKAADAAEEAEKVDESKKDKK